MAASKAEQERMQADLTASQARNDELHRANEELRRGWRVVDEPEATTPPREFSTPFSQAILETTIPNTFTGPKVTFTGIEDPKAHLTAFHTQMMLVGGSDAVRCNLFMRTLTGMAMDWFISLSEGHITSFAQLSRLCTEQYLANRAPAPVSYDLFDVKQYQGETLKEYISRFGAQVVKVGTIDERMIVYAFRKGVCPGSFSKSLNRSCPKTFAEVRRRAVEHIASEGEAYEKCTTAAPTRPRAQMRAQPARVHEATIERKNPDRRRTYETRRTQPRGRSEGRREGNRPLRQKFVVELKDLIVVPNIADRLRPPVRSDKVLGPHKESWCEFHEAFGHHINNCLALGYQLDELVKNGFLKDYLAGSTTTAVTATPEEGQAHEVPTHGEVHTIFGGFSGGGPTASQHKKYVRLVSLVAEESPDDSWESDLVFTRADLRDVVPHDNDPVVISVVTAGRKVHRLLVDQGSSADVMFWSTFNKLQLSPDLLRPYTECLYGFADNPVEVRGYLELRTTFTDGAASRTESIRYLVVNANSAYNILLGRPALNRLRAVSSTHHMKMKLPDLSGKVIVIKSDQEEARKCYENSLKTKRGVVMVVERPLVSDSQMESELLGGATRTKFTLDKATLGATPIEDAHTERRNGDASPMEGVHGEASPAEEEPEEVMPDASVGATPMEEDSTNEPLAENVQNERPRPEDNIVEKQIGGKVFKLGRLLSQGEQEEVAAVISRHLDAFVWTAADMPGIDPDFLCHHLTMDAKVRPVRQRRRKFNEERCLVVKEETQKLLSAGHIRVIQYPEWLANVVLVKKSNGKWRMCVDFTDLNKACPKDSYPLPNIDALVDSLGLQDAKFLGCILRL
ncbi:uncharacterized protein [Phaseolus vulgaris]|uniref:uncharacterized protein n=1 Tax=Phaseolus vulgaris TaxID=3885 RepID=UPI0035C9F675